MLPSLWAGLAVLLLAGCHHANRVSPSRLERLRKNNTPFTLVFGTLSGDAGQLAHPTIRVVRQPTPASPESVLWSWSVNSSGRFFAVLQAPPDLPYLDEFYVEAGDPAVGFDRVLFIRLRKGDPPTGMYVGDLHISPAPDRTIQGQTVKVEVLDDFDAAARELKRLYPRFDSPVIKAGLFRNNRPPVAVERR